MPVFFFFSSRRRHTRCSRDWSSDVCSSDLPRATLGGAAGARVESAPVTALTIVPKRKRVIGPVLAILGIPELLVLVEAGSFHGANRANGIPMYSGRKCGDKLNLQRGDDPAYDS